MLDEYIEYPNDKEWKNEWSDIPDGYNWGLEAIKMPEAWDFVSKKSLNTVNIGVMETCGFQEDHVDLKENVHSSLGNYDQTDLAHGTQVCGIIAAEYNNKKGISGITKNKGKIDFFSYKGVNNPKYADLMTYKIGLIYLCDMAKQNKAIPFDINNGKIKVCFANTVNNKKMDAIRLLVLNKGLVMEPYITFEQQIVKLLKSLDGEVSEDITKTGNSSKDVQVTYT